MESFDSVNFISDQLKKHSRLRDKENFYLLSKKEKKERGGKKEG